jgi:zinc finger protein 830
LESQKQKSSTLQRQSDDTGSEGRSVHREVAVIQPKTIGASTDKSSVRMDQMSKKGSQSNTSVKGILPGNFFDRGEEDEAPTPVPKDLSTSQNVVSSIHKKVKGVPDGFFDHNKTGSGMQPNEPSSETAQAKRIVA